MASRLGLARYLSRVGQNEQAVVEYQTVLGIQAKKRKPMLLGFDGNFRLCT